MDNPSSESSSINTNEAASLFSSMMDGEQGERDQAETPESAAERLVVEEANGKPEEAAADAPADEAKISFEVDGKTVELTRAELADSYKNGLRQADYTQKTMAVAEARKAADAEASAARAERADYAQRLNNHAIQLQGALQEQAQTNWQQLLETDPVEYLKQERIFSQRQAALQQAQGEQSRIYQQQQSEQAETANTYRATQQQELLAKLPEWKDADKARAESAQIKEYLTKQGFSPEKINSINDAADVLMHRKAMMYDALIARAATATKKVSALPAKVERPGNGTVPTDGRTDAMKRLSKSGSIGDAAAVFSRMF